MSIPSLEELFNPRAIAIVGASERFGNPFTQIWHAVKDSHANARIFPINPKYRYIGDYPALSNVHELTENVDLAILATQPQHRLSSIEALASKGVKWIIITPNCEFNTEETRKIKKICTSKNTLILGPSSLGVINKEINLNASFLPINKDENSGFISLLSEGSPLAEDAISFIEKYSCGLNKFIDVSINSFTKLSHIVRGFEKDSSSKVISIILSSETKDEDLVSAIFSLSKVKKVLIYTPVLTNKINTYENALLAALRKTKATLFSDFRAFLLAHFFASRKMHLEGNALGILSNSLELTNQITRETIATSFSIPEIFRVQIDDETPRSKVYSCANPFTYTNLLNPRKLLAVSKKMLAHPSVNALIVAIDPTLLDSEHALLNFKEFLSNLEHNNSVIEKPIGLVVHGKSHKKRLVEFIKSNRNSKIFPLLFIKDFEPLLYEKSPQQVNSFFDKEISNSFAKISARPNISWLEVKDFFLGLNAFTEGKVKDGVSISFKLLDPYTRNHQITIDWPKSARGIKPIALEIPVHETCAFILRAIKNNCAISALLEEKSIVSIAFLSYLTSELLYLFPEIKSFSMYLTLSPSGLVLTKGNLSSSKKVKTLLAYPPQYIKNWALKGETFSLRALTEHNSIEINKFIRNLSTQSYYYRFHTASPMKFETVRLSTSVDWATASIMGLWVQQNGSEKLVAIIEWKREKTEVAEFGIIVSDSYQRKGLGKKLIQFIAKAAIKQGYKELVGYLLPGNESMIGLVTKLGFQLDPLSESETLRFVLKLANE